MIYYGGVSRFGVPDSRAQPIKNGRISPSRAFVVLLLYVAYKLWW